MSVSYGAIVDSVATDHMTYSSQLFRSYAPCLSNRKIIVANDSSTVAGFGDIQLPSKPILKDVLHGPKHLTSLLSIKNLTYDLNCFEMFSPSLCVFQDQDSGRRIGLGQQRNGLYYLEPFQESKVDGPMSHLNISNEATLWLYHCCLGHPSFSVF